MAGGVCVLEVWDGKASEFLMRIKNLLWFTMPVIFATGCTTTYYDTYGRSEVVVPPPTSTSSAVRVYPDPMETPHVTSPVPADEWSTGVAVRNLIAGDEYLKGATRNVDIEIVRGAAILRGTVISEYDKQELAGRIGHVPGVTVVDNRLDVAHM